jgi:hypothetical protein
MLHTYLSPPSELRDRPEQAAQYHILGPSFGGFVSDPKFGWLQSTEDFLRHEMKYYETEQGILLSRVSAFVSTPNRGEMLRYCLH